MSHCHCRKNVTCNSTTCSTTYLCVVRRWQHILPALRVLPYRSIPQDNLEDKARKDKRRSNKFRLDMMHHFKVTSFYVVDIVLRTTRSWLAGYTQQFKGSPSQDANLCSVVQARTFRYNAKHSWPFAVAVEDEHHVVIITTHVSPSCVASYSFGR